MVMADIFMTKLHLTGNVCVILTTLPPRKLSGTHFTGLGQPRSYGSQNIPCFVEVLNPGVADYGQNVHVCQ